MNKRKENETVVGLILGTCGMGAIIVVLSVLFMMMEVPYVLPSENDPWLCMKTVSDLNVRKSPVLGDVVEVLPEGTTVYVQVPEVRGYDSWAKIILQDEEYWVNCYFLKEEEEEYAEAAEEEEYAEATEEE